MKINFDRRLDRLNRGLRWQALSAAPWLRNSLRRFTY
jgi:hypothetical protein